jgi:hypothetical protein
LSLLDALRSPENDDPVRRLAFADAPPDFIETLLSADVTNLFGEEIQLRNTWRGHSGMTSQSSPEDHLSILTGRVRTMRNLIGASWLDFPLARAGAARIGNGVFHRQPSERTATATAPFGGEFWVI